MTSRKPLSLRNRLASLSALIIIPLAALTIALLVILMDYNQSYSKVVNNITEVNPYNVEFEENINYSMYSTIIGQIELDKDKDVLTEGDSKYSRVIQNPYKLIEKARKTFRHLLRECTNTASVSRIRGSLSCLDSLENVIGQIETNIKTSGTYSENYSIWENDIQGLTAMIRDYTQEYIYYETQTLIDLRIKMEARTNTIILMTAGMLALILFISVMSTKRIIGSVTKPIDALCKAAKRMEHGDFTEETNIEAVDEISVLTDSFNGMRSEISRLIEDIKGEQRKLRDTELKLLQAQINPHFLYNTLDAIVWLAEDGQNRKVVNMTTSLSEFFRTVLSQGKDYITIKEEETHVHSYLSIQQFRYQDIMEYEISIDKELYQYRILKMVLQPLVENALYHGIKNKRGKGKIWVRGYASAGIIVLEVEDNGIGMTEDQLAELREKIKGKENPQTSARGGFGLLNVEERIQMNYGKQYGLAFESFYGKGTRVTVRIPKENVPLSKENTPRIEEN